MSDDKVSVLSPEAPIAHACVLDKCNMLRRADAHMIDKKNLEFNLNY